MTKTLWRLVAPILAYPPIANWLIRQAMKRPYTHIGGYMHRYWLVPQDWKLPFAIRVNHILQPDADPYLHDHPWDWRTVVLKGGYIEEDAFGCYNDRRRGITAVATAETFHRISFVSDGGVYTLFITGRRRNRWGFMVPTPDGAPRKMYYRDYNSPNGSGDEIEGTK